MPIDSFSSIAFPGGYENGFAFPNGYPPPIVRGPGDVVYTVGSHQVNPFGIRTIYSTFFKTDYATGVGVVGPLLHVFSPGYDPGAVVVPDRNVEGAGVADDLGRLWFAYDSFFLGHPAGHLEWGPTDPDSGNLLFTITIPNNQNQPYASNGMGSFVDNGINYVGGLAQALNDAFSAIVTNLILYDSSNGSILLNVSVTAPGSQQWIDFATAVPWVLSDGSGYCYGLSFEQTSNSSPIVGSWIFKFNLATGGYTVHSYSGLYSILMDYNAKQILGYTQDGSIQVIDCGTMNVINTIPNIMLVGVPTGLLGGAEARGNFQLMLAQSTTDKGPIADPLHCSFLVVLQDARSGVQVLRRLHLPDFGVLDDEIVPPYPVPSRGIGPWLYLYGEQAMIWTDNTPAQWQLNYSPSFCARRQQPNTSLIT